MFLFTADNHFCHKNIIKYCFRPFDNVKDMNDAMINNWNKAVKKTDTVFVVGDFILSNNFNEVKSILDSLNGDIILIKGDHDYSSTDIYPNRFIKIEDIFSLNLSNAPPDPLYVTLCHFAMRVWPKSHYNSWHLFGHSHGHLPALGKSYDVGVDCNHFTPVPLEQIVEVMKKKEDNFNLIKPKKEEVVLAEQLEMEFKWIGMN
jgi:calcineurin-like phosphoesterase family protein